MSTTLLDGLKTGATLAAATAAVMMTASRLRSGSVWAGFNAMATAVGRGRDGVFDRFRPRVTPVGFAVLTAGLIGWGAAYRAALSAAGRRGSLATGILSAAGGYLIDRVLLPRTLVPDFRRSMGDLGTAAKYATLAVTSARAAG